MSTIWSGEYDFMKTSILSVNILSVFQNRYTLMAHNQKLNFRELDLL